MAAALAVALVAYGGGGGGGDVLHAGEPEQTVAQNPEPYGLTGTWQIPDLSAPFPEYAFAQLQSGAFVTTWQTTSANESITIPAAPAGRYTIDWGDGTVVENVSDTQTHEYANPGNYQVSITGDPRFIRPAQDNAAKLISIDQWGDIRWNAMQAAFRDASKMIYNATDAPDLSRVANMVSMFLRAASFDGDLSSWNVSSATDMGRMFYGATSFDGNISGWDVSSVTRMNDMFHDATSFDGDLSAWDVSSVTDMTNMFHGAASFNGNISGWDVSFVRSMDDMFNGTDRFAQNLGGWYVVLDDHSIIWTDVPGVVGQIRAQNSILDFHIQEYGIGGGGDPGRFEIVNGNELNMTSVGEKSSYRVNVTASGEATFGSGDHWRMVDVTVSGKPPSPDSFVTTWNVYSGGSIITIPATGTYTIDWGDGTTDENVNGTQTHEYEDFGTPTVSISGGLESFSFAADSTSAYNLRSIDQWGSIEWTTMEGAFQGTSDMAYNAADTPDLTRVTNMSNMFRDATSFNGNLSDWNVSSVTDMSDMFYYATSFDGNLSDWNVSSVTDMSNMFDNAAAFNGNLSDWDVSSVTDMSNTFYYATSFDGNLSGWNVSSVTDMSNMFDSAAAFNQPIGSWNVSSVTDMSNMFFDATSFNQPIGSWNVSSVTDMSFMFYLVDNFVQNLGEWYVVPNSTSIDLAAIPGIVGSISAQNNFLDSRHFPEYGIGGGGDSGRFEIVNGNELNMTSVEEKSSYQVNVTASGGQVFESDTNWRMLNVTVTGTTNSAPELATIGPQGIDELATLEFTASATDDDNDTLTYSLTGTPPTGAAIDQTTGVFSWTPSELQDGTHTITVQVADGNGGSASETVTVTVSEVNVAPSLASIGPQSVDELATLEFTASATDGDFVNNVANTLTYSLTGTPPTGAAIHQNTGVFSWTPTASQAGQHTITVQVADGTGATDSGDVTVTVSDSNVNPVLASIGPQSVDELATLEFTASATDDDNDTLTYSLTGTPPTGAAIDQTTGVFSWTPSELQDGTHTITVQVADGNGGSASETVTVTVNEVNVAPSLASIGPQSVAEMATLEFTASATDDDTIGGTADTLTYSLTGTPPTGAAIHQNTGVFSWTPTASQAGQHTITVQVADGTGATDSGDVTVTVSDSNVNPVLASIGPQSVDELATLEFTASATDGDNDTLTYSLTGTPPTGAAIDQTTGVFSWTPSELQDGTHAITVRVADGNGGSASETVTVTVSEVNVRPTLDSIGPKSINSLESLTFTANASDDDFINLAPDTLEFSLGTGHPDGASINPTSGEFSWTPAANQTGRHGITVTVTDGAGAVDSEDIEVTVGQGGANTPPVLGKSSGDRDVSRQSRSATAPPPAITIGSQNHPQTTFDNWLKDFGNQEVIVESQDRQLSAVPVPGTAMPEPVDSALATDVTFPLVINGNGYALHSHSSTVMPTNVTAGQPVTMQVTLYDPAPISYFAIYLNLQGDSISHLQSDAQVVWDSGNVRVSDPNGLMRGVTMTVSEDPGDPAMKAATLTAAFSEDMGKTNMVIRTWNAGGHITQVQVFGVIAVTPPVPETVDPGPTAPLVTVNPEPGADSSTDGSLLAVRMWSGFEPESMTDAQLLASLGLDYPGTDIPGWVMTELGPLAAKGHVSMDEFMTALEYVLNHG